MNILNAQLYYSCVSKSKDLAMVVYCDLEFSQTLIKTFRLTGSTPVESKQEIVSFSIKFIACLQDHWLYLLKENKTLHKLVKGSWDTLQPVEEVDIEASLFAHNMVVSPDEASLAMATFENKTVDILDVKHMRSLGSGNAKYTPYVQGMSFSPSSDALGFVNFDQGGGHAVCLRKSAKGYEQAYDVTGKQFKDDVNMNANIVFDGEDMIVTVVEMGQHFHVVRYDKAGKQVWSNAFTSVINIDLSEEKIRPNAYFERIWNQQHKAVIHQGHIYVGANSKIHVIDAKTGAVSKTILCAVKGFAHQLHLTGNDSLFALDCLGNTALVSLQAEGLEGEQWYNE